MVSPEHGFTKLVNAGDRVGPHKPDGGAVLRAVGPPCPMAQEGGSKDPLPDVSRLPGGTVNRSDRAFFGLTTCHAEAERASASHVFWNARENRDGNGHYQSLSLRMSVNTSQNVTWMSTHLIILSLVRSMCRHHHSACSSRGTIFEKIISLNFAQGKVAWALFTVHRHFIWILSQAKF